METSLLNQWFSGHQVNAICWTLIHSLWIGLIIALLCGIIVATTRKSTASLRYRLLCGLLVLFVCAIGVTYYLEASSTPAHNMTGHAQNILVNAPAYTVANPMIVAQNQPFLENVQAFLNQNANIIVLVWLLFFVLKSLKMVSGLLYIQRIRHYKTSDVTEELKHRIEQFSNQIGIRRVVRLVQSELVKVPVAVGWLKPMILLPVGIAFQLTPEQLDGILWHELAHIRRRDYLVNILQGLVETVFFFNPGLLWLSSLIRTEREACCDDMVLSRMNRKANYLEALLSFGNGEFSQARYAMSIGSGNQLRDRLKRMISQENKKLSMAEKSVLAIGLVCLTAFTTISKDNPIIRHLTLKYTNKSGKVVTKTMAVSMHRLPAGQRKDDKKRGAQVKDTIIVRDTAIRFTSVLFKHSDADLANNDISAKDTKGNIYHFIVADGKIASMDLNGAKIEESKLPDYEYVFQSIISQLMEKRRVREGDIARFKANQPGVKFKTGRRFDDKHRDVDSMELADLKVMNEIIANLVLRKVVSKLANVKWFALTDNEFIVNGQKQPEELQQRYKAKYGVHEGYGLYYGPVPMKGKGVFIDPEGMMKERRLNDSIRSGQFKARLGTDDAKVKAMNPEARALMHKLQLMKDSLKADERNARAKYLSMSEPNAKMIKMRQRMHEDSISYNAELKRMMDIIADLVKNGVVANAADVKWFGLSNTEFIVNGQKLSNEMQQRYKAKYRVSEGNGLYYGPVQMTGRGVFIDAMDMLPRSQRPGPKPVGVNGSWSNDSILMKQQELIRQQKLFVANEDAKRVHIVDQQIQLVAQQQRFKAEQDEKHNQAINHQQQTLANHDEQIKVQGRWSPEQELAAQQKMQEKLRAQHPFKPGIDLKTPIYGIIADLVSANVISDKSDLVKFNLTNTALMVNGKKQSDELHERLKAKYLEQPNYPLELGIAKDPNFGLHFNAQNGAMGLGVTEGPDSP